MRKKIRYPALLMATVLAASSVSATGCGRNKDLVVQADSPWYDLHKVTIGEQYKSDDSIAAFNMYYIGRAEDLLLFSTCGNYKNRQDSGDYLQDFLADTFQHIDVYDLDGTLINSFDQLQFLQDEDLIDTEYPNLAWSTYVDDDKIAYEYEGMKYLLDPYTGEVVGSSEIPAISLEDGAEGSFEMGDYIVDIYTGYDPGGCSNEYILDIKAPDGSDTETTVAVEDFAYIDGMLYMGDDEALFRVTDGGYTPDIFYSLDLTTGQIEEYTEETGWFRDDLDQAKYIEGVGNIVVNSYGIRKLDFETQTKTQVLDFECCNINRYDAMNLELLDMTEDRVIMAGSTYTGNSYFTAVGDGSLDIYIMDRQDTNPNAGKRIITAATLDTFDYAVCEAVCSYNETNEDYFIRLDSKYSTDARYANGELDYYSDSVTDEYLTSTGELSNQLMVDLIAGEGPDIILNGATFTQLNSDDLLIDLSDAIDTEGLFVNVIDAARTGERLYQLPLAVNIAGIIAKKDDVSPDQTGFTFDQYEEYVFGPCNGSDPIGNGQLDFLTTALSSICEQCTADGIADFDNESFRDLAEYVNDNVHEEIVIDEEDAEDIDPYLGVRRDAGYVSDISFGYLMYNYSDIIEDIRLMGFPTTDGRGPGLTVRSSVAISAQTNEEDACKEFVGTLLSEEIQYDFGKFDGASPVRISSFEQSARDIVDMYNDMYETYSGMYTTGELRILDLPWHSVDYSIVDGYEEVIRSCTYINFTDPSIVAIVREEMPSYFCGQKTLDEVISIIEDRTQTLLDERK